MLNSLKKTYNDFPPLFWVIVFTLFIDSIGSSLLFPFFSLYITEKFGVGMTQAGVLLGMSSLFGLVGSIVGGALTDKFGRRTLILFGLVFSALSSLLFGFASDINFLYVIIVIVGLLSRVAPGRPRRDDGGYPPRRQTAETAYARRLQFFMDLRHGSPAG
ncbi:MAG: MFS transporter [Anaerolineales bacterium]